MYNILCCIVLCLPFLAPGFADNLVSPMSLIFYFQNNSLWNKNGLSFFLLTLEYIL